MSGTFIADLHIHSKYSRATARNLDLENIYIWAQLKGISVVGTGDFTHPEWFEQISIKLEPAEPGLFKLKSDIAGCCDDHVPPSCRAPVRFMLSCEISNIYKRKGVTRKNHNLVFFSKLPCASQFNARLATIGNICSDGRPILGLDARDLLEIVLETSDDAFLVPAHIWTPWFSMLGSKSGFDSIESCFGDLSPHIFAAETGLSSDPAMNWRVADLDNITLISNSDAHSPSKLGRESNLFNTEMNYYAIRSALEKGDKNRFAGTFEFYPQEGKYHLDGHRKCEICFTPAETQSHSGCCPVCGKPLTLGVLHRVEGLASRPEGIRPDRAFPFYRLIPLDELLSEILKVGPQSKKVKQNYLKLLEKLGNEFNILHRLDINIIKSTGMPLLAEAILRMRENRVSFSPGYDGLFGTVHIFSDRERKRLLGQRSLFSAFEKSVNLANTEKKGNFEKFSEKANLSLPSAVEIPIEAMCGLNADQQAAVNHANGPLMILAGPGTGKTRTLTHRIARLIQKGAKVEQMLAVTFTNKAAGEMKARLKALLGGTASLPFVGTFHSLGYRILSRSKANALLSVADEQTRNALIRDALKLSGVSIQHFDITTDNIINWIASAKLNMRTSQEFLKGACPQGKQSSFRRCYKNYQRLLQVNGLVDFEDLILRPVQCLKNDPDTREQYAGRFNHLFIDEYQDINAGQYQFVRLLAGKHADICIIGDPDQSIYGFRGSDVACFKWFREDYVDARTLFLGRNYRSTQTILDVSRQVIQHNPDLQETGYRRKVYSKMRGDPTITLMPAASEKAEAVAIGKSIDTMMGGTGFFSLDSGAVDSTADRESMSFADFAVLFRTRRQGDVILRVLEKAGIPCQMVNRRAVIGHPGVKAVISIFKLLCGKGIFMDIQVAAGVFKPRISTKVLEVFKSWAYQNRLSLAEALIQARRLPIPNMGRTHQQQLYAYTNQLFEFQKITNGLQVADTLEWIVQAAGIRKKYAADPPFETGYDIIHKIGKAHITDKVGFLATVAMSGNTDIYDHRVERVALITMHAAKGLEFPVVFISGCEDDCIPYQSISRPSDPEEERRLFYVAMTRAKKHLFLTKAKYRRVNGQMGARAWSPFVKEIENSYKRYSGGSGRKAGKPAQEQLSLFRLR